MLRHIGYPHARGRLACSLQDAKGYDRPRYTAFIAFSFLDHATTGALNLWVSTLRVGAASLQPETCCTFSPCCQPLV